MTIIVCLINCVHVVAGLRKTMLRAHRQAWCWQDEYHGLTIDDIRRLERETQLALQEKMTSSEAALSQPAVTDGQLTAGNHSCSVLLFKKGKVFPYSLPSVGPGADPGVQAVSPQVT